MRSYGKWWNEYRIKGKSVTLSRECEWNGFSHVLVALEQEKYANITMKNSLIGMDISDWSKRLFNESKGRKKRWLVMRQGKRLVYVIQIWRRTFNWGMQWIKRKLEYKFFICGREGHIDKYCIGKAVRFIKNSRRKLTWVTVGINRRRKGIFKIL